MKTKSEVPNEQIIEECARCAHCGEPIVPYMISRDGMTFWTHKHALLRCVNDTSKFASLDLGVR